MTSDVDGATLRARAAAIADEVLFPAALRVDRSDRVPAASLDLLAAEGLYGMAAPPAADLATAGGIVAELAGGCLATTFVWLQHHTSVLAVSGADPGLAQRWLAPLARGQRRSGIALAGLRPGTAGMRVTAVDGGYRLDGEAPWVTGWDMIDVVYLAARDPADVIHYLLVDAVAAPTLTVAPLELVAVQASRTVHLRFTGHHVAADRLVRTQPYAEWAHSDAAGSTLNGFLALGVAGRACRLLGPSGLDAELDAHRAALLAADGAAVAAARADASALALRATATLAAHTGSRAVLRDSHVQRLVREAAFLLVFGSRPAIRAALLAKLAAAP
jgi:alkylation response protein AidB-like acyl-CoA dehydrogenase